MLSSVDVLTFKDATSHNSSYVHRRPSGGSGSAALRRAAPPHRPLASVRLGAASHTSYTLCETRIILDRAKASVLFIEW